MMILYAQKTILIQGTVIRLKGQICFLRKIHKPPAADSHAVADPTQIPVDIILRNRPRRTDIIIIQELIPPHLRMHDKPIRMHHHNKIRMDIISQLIKHLIIKTVNIRQLRGMCIPNTLRQKERFPMRDQHTIPKINLTHAVLHRLDRLPHIDTRHRHQRHIRKLQPAVFPLHNKSSFHLKPLPALQLPHRPLIFYYHTASAIPMQAGRSSLRKL
jgi:hypothetical protein